MRVVGGAPRQLSRGRLQFHGRLPAPPRPLPPPLPQRSPAPQAVHGHIAIIWRMHSDATVVVSKHWVHRESVRAWQLGVYEVERAQVVGRQWWRTLAPPRPLRGVPGTPPVAAADSAAVGSADVAKEEAEIQPPLVAWAATAAARAWRSASAVARWAMASSATASSALFRSAACSGRTKNSDSGTRHE